LHVTAEVVDLVAEGFDLAIRLCPTEDPSRIVRRIGGTRLVVAAAPALLQGRELPQAPEDLVAFPCLVNSTHPWRKGWRFRQGEQSRVVALEPRLVANNHETLRRLVLAGGGIAALSEYALTEDLKAGRIVRLLPKWSVVDIPVLAVYPDNRKIAVKVKAFVDFVARRLEPETLMAHSDAPAPPTPFPAKARQSAASMRGAAQRA
jgi:DNA-binding transcriptional LysR family regulator